MPRLLAAWHAVLAVAGAALLTWVALPLRSGDLFYAQPFVWTILGGAALLGGGVGGVLERPLVVRRHPVVAGAVAAVMSYPVLVLDLFFIMKLPHALVYARSPDTLVVPLTGWLLFHVVLGVLALRPVPEGRRQPAEGAEHAA